MEGIITSVRSYDKRRPQPTDAPSLSERGNDSGLYHKTD